MSAVTFKNPDGVKSSSAQAKKEIVDRGMAVIDAAMKGDAVGISTILAKNGQILKGFRDIAARFAIVKDDPKCMEALLANHAEVSKEALIDIAAQYVAINCMSLLIGEEPKILP